MADYSIPAGSTSQSVTVWIGSSGVTTGAGLTGLTYNASGLTAYYTFDGTLATATGIVLANLSAVNSAYASGGFKEIDSTHMPGAYRLDLPDAALATGNQVTVILQGVSGMRLATLKIELTSNALSLALAIFSDTLTFRPDSSRTHVMRRGNGIVGSTAVITKKYSEEPEFYADVSSLLGTNEFIGAVSDISITATTATVLNAAPHSIRKIGKTICYTLLTNTGTVGATDTITIQFNSVDVNGNLIGTPTICTGLIKHIA